ncbi:TPA: hypothetical protein EYP44_04215 [Candidatus Bathyarchaeota archaeon]|nr:hypothetical protein [Candidatus Bathyarchaeota archaeon]
MGKEDSSSKDKDESNKAHWVTFFNRETERALKEYLAERKDSDPRLFPMNRRTAIDVFLRGQKRTGIRITAQTLREWFACEMGRLGVPDRYVDAFCGRVPRSVLARHYTDYSPETLREIYDSANLTVLT